MIPKNALKPAILLGTIFIASQVFGKNVFTWRCVHWPTASTVTMASTDYRNLLQRMSAVGYNGMFIDGWQFRALEDDPKKAPKMVAAIKDYAARAKSLGIQIIPQSQYQLGNTHMPQDLREGFPNRGTRFLVQNGVATTKTDPSIAIKNPGFEEGFSGWKNPTGQFKIDNNVRKSGGASMLCADPNQQMIRLVQVVKVKPYQTYELSAWVKTQGLKQADHTWNSINPSCGTFFTVRANNNYILENREWPGVGSNTRWKEFSQNFYSGEHTRVEVWLHATCWYRLHGKVWFDDVKIREVGLQHTLDRVNMPVVVKTAAGKTLTEGKDYVIGDEKLTIPSGSSAKNGDELLVDWYSEGAMFSAHPEAVFCYDEVWDGMREQIRYEDAVYGISPIKHMKYDEWRMGGWDPKCMEDYNIATEGSARYLASVVNKTAQIYMEGNSNRIATAYSTMFNPYHLNQPQYKMINGGFLGSGNLLSEDLIILLWGPNRRKSLLYFAGMDTNSFGIHGVRTRRNRVLLSCNASAAAAELKMLDSMEANDNLPDDAVAGIYYVNWKVGIQYYDTRIEAIAEQSKAAKRWGTGPIPFKPPRIAGGKQAAQGGNLSLRTSVNSIGSVRELSFTTPTQGKVQLAIVNLCGQIVSKIMDERMAAGSYKSKVDISKMAPGVYFATLKVVGKRVRQMTKKMVLF